MISAVPTHIITGFLGVGKTSAILQLLKHKPSDERWAVLVNEFGEIGVDGSLLEGQYTPAQSVFIKEVPGGCMCCTAGLPMQVALNQLLKTAKPDRLFIEPTGLGHPTEVLQSLRSESYATALSLQKVVTLVDARKLSDSRYTSHKTFNEQIAIADIVVGNKQELYQEKDKYALIAYVKEHGVVDAPVFFTQNGDLTALALMSHHMRPAAESVSVGHHHNHDHNHLNHQTDSPSISLSDMPIPSCGYIKSYVKSDVKSYVKNDIRSDVRSDVKNNTKTHNPSEGFYSVGWRFASDKIFSYQQLSLWVNEIQAERMKAVFITDKGIVSYNLTLDTLTEDRLHHGSESRIEMIAIDINTIWEERLMSCLIT